MRSGLNSEHFCIDFELSEPSTASLDIIEQILKEKCFCDFWIKKLFLNEKGTFFKLDFGDFGLDLDLGA